MELPSVVSKSEVIHVHILVSADDIEIKAKICVPRLPIVSATPVLKQYVLSHTTTFLGTKGTKGRSKIYVTYSPRWI